MYTQLTVRGKIIFGLVTESGQGASVGCINTWRMAEICYSNLGFDTNKTDCGSTRFSHVHSFAASQMTRVCSSYCVFYGHIHMYTAFNSGSLVELD